MRLGRGVTREFQEQFRRLLSSRCGFAELYTEYPQVRKKRAKYQTPPHTTDQAERGREKFKSLGVIDLQQFLVKLRGQVDPGDLSPGPPTDPDVRD